MTDSYDPANDESRNGKVGEYFLDQIELITDFRVLVYSFVQLNVMSKYL